MSPSAIIYRRTGAAADVLELVDKPLQEPGPDEVRVRIAVSGVNPTDWKARAGNGTRVELPRPQVPDQDGAGVVDAVGANVEYFTPGERVWVWDAAYQNPEGTAQEYALVEADRVVALPADVSFDVGASIGIPALTAHRALTAREGGPVQLEPHSLDKVIVLVTGGAGAVSHAAIQLAVWAGATVITTVSGEAKGDLARRAGAQHVLNYKTQDVAAEVRAIAPEGADIVIDVNAMANIDTDLAVLARGGTVAIYAANPGDVLPLPVREAMAVNARIQFILTYTTSKAQKDAAVNAVSAALRDHALEVGDAAGLPLLRFPLAQTAAAHEAVEHDAVGKVLIDVAQLTELPAH